MADDWLREARMRLASRFEPGCWIAIVAKAIDADTREAGGRLERTPPHFLVGAWAPGDDGLYPRLPEFAAIASPDGERALRELFAHLPPQARVHLTDEHHADVELLARMVLACDRNLEDYQREALERFAQRRRQALHERIRQRYTDREGDFERFRDRLLAGGEMGGDTKGGDTKGGLEGGESGEGGEGGEGGDAADDRSGDAGDARGRE